MVKIANITKSHFRQFWRKMVVVSIFDQLKKMFLQISPTIVKPLICFEQKLMGKCKNLELPK